MPPLPVCSGAEAIRALKRAGFVEKRQKGSHVSLSGPDGQRLVVPLHKELRAGTLRAIIRQADLTVDEFRDLL